MAASEWIEVKVKDGSLMRCYRATPDSSARGGMLVFQEAFGVNPHIRDVTERMARKGFVALAPELYHRTGRGFEGSYGDFSAVMPHMQAMTDEGLSADITAAHALLAKEQEKIGCIGFCMGGRCSYLAATVVSLKCAVSFYGGGIAPSQGRSGMLDKASSVNCPILLFWGGMDKHILPEHYNGVESALRDAEKDYVQVVMSKADHGFYCDVRPAYNPVSAREAEALFDSFFAEHMGE